MKVLKEKNKYSIEDKLRIFLIGLFLLKLELFKGLLTNQLSFVHYFIWIPIPNNFKIHKSHQRNIK